jgi:hypothetical protein
VPKKRQLLLLLIVTVFLLASSYAQSLGDIARQQREKAKDSPSAHQVITNDDIPESPEASADPSSKDAQETPSAATEPKKTGDQWKADIEAQRNSVEALQKHIDKLKESIRFAPVTEYNNGYQWNLRQLKKEDQVERMEAQLEEQKKKLEDMQEGARKQGFGNSVYEPAKDE